MANFFVSLYRFFQNHKTVLYSVIAGTTLLFAFFAFQVRFEENILELLPKSSRNAECEVAFGDIKIKDKFFVEILSRSGEMSPRELAESMDDFLTELQARDEEGYIANSFNRLDADDFMNLLYYGMGALPCHLGEGFYSALDTLLNEDTIDAYATGKLDPPAMDTGGYILVDGHIMSPDSTLALAFLSPSVSSIDTYAGNKFETVISGCVRDFEEAHPDCEVLYHGAASEGTFNSRRIRNDLLLTVGISLILICLLLCISLRSRRTILHILCPVAYGTLFSLAVIYLIKGEMSYIAMGIGAIVLGVAISYCLHVIIHRKFVSDVETVIAEQAKPVCLGCITTIGAFAGLLLTSSDLLKDFGIFASLSLIGTTFFALVFLPHFFTEDDGRKNDRVFDFVNRLNSYPLDRNIPVVVLLSLIIIVSIFESRNVGFDSDLSHIGYREPKIVRSETIYNDRVFDHKFAVYYAAHASTLDSAITYNRMLSHVLDSLKGGGMIYSYSGVDGILVPYEEQIHNIGLWKSYWTEDKVESAYQLIRKESEKYGWSGDTGFDIPETFRMMACADYEPQSLYEAGVVPEALLCNFVENNESGWLVFSTVLLDRVNLKTVNDAVASSPHAVILDPFYYTGDMVEIAHDDFNVVLLVSSIFVFLVLLLSFRSIVLAIISFLPMFLSWYVVQGLMAVFGIQFNLINIMISTFVFGIGVDYSIFVMEGLVSRHKYQSHRLLVCHKAAIFFSGVILLIVTASLLFAKHPAIHSIGISTIIGMTSTILITYALQPLLFRAVMKTNWLRKETKIDK